jgi:hypothetical protein
MHASISTASRPLKHLRSIVITLILITLSLAARAQVVGGTIVGTVTDSSGAVIPNAHVLVHNDDTGTQRSLTTSASGAYAAPSIPVGTYTVSVDAPGFAHYTRKNITLTIGQSLNLTLALAISGSETINVQNTPAAVNTSTEQTSGRFDSRQIQELPLDGRSYDRLIPLNPAAVNSTNLRSGSSGTSNSLVGNAFSVSGRRPQDNLFLLNGVEYTGASLTNTPGGASGQLLGVDAVRAVNLVTDTYSAAYGKRDGAQISIVTNSGTNNLHGNVYEFLRNSYFDARNYFDLPRIPEFQRNSLGGSLGGPLWHDKLFLFANYEGYRQNLGLSLVSLVPDNEARLGFLPNSAGVEKATTVSPISAQLLNLWPVQNGPEILNNGLPTGIAESFNTAPQHVREDFGTTRLDANLTANDLLFAVYTIDDSVAQTHSQNPYTDVDPSTREQVLSIQEQHVFSPRLLNTARVGYSRASSLLLSSVTPAIQAESPTFFPGKPTGSIVISGSTATNGASALTTAGTSASANNAIARNLFTFDDHIFYTAGKHQIEAGVWLQRIESNSELAQTQYGQASFLTLSSFLAGSIKSFGFIPNSTELAWRTLFASAYLEDTFHITPRVEIRAGFRSESSTGWNEAQGRAGVYSFTNGVINTNPSVQSNALDHNLALFLPEPRIGLSWNVFGNGKTSVRAGAGLHHSLLDSLDYRLDQAAPYNTAYSSSSSTVAAPTIPTPLINPSTVDSSLATPALLSYSLKIEQLIAPATSLTIGYEGSHSYHQVLSGDLNEPAYTVLANGTIFYPTIIKANAALAKTTSWWSGGSGNYNALTVDLRHDLSHGLQFRANYTWSKNLDDGSAWSTSVSSNTPAFLEVPSLPHLDYGPAATDVRSLASVNATYNLPVGNGKAFLSNTGKLTGNLISGWSLSTIANLQTGFPFSPQLGYNPTGSGDSRNPVRPDINPAFTGSLYTHGTTAQKATQYFNPNAFSAPAYGDVGNARRDSLVGPSFADWDLALLKDTQLTERTRLQFRADFFNILNHTNLSIPNEIVYSAGPTQGTTATQTTVATLGSPGVITATANPSRQIQFGLKLLF